MTTIPPDSLPAGSSDDRTPDVLERNVETLLEGGGEPPRISELGRARIRVRLLAAHGRDQTIRTRSPVFAVGVGLAAVAAGALLVTRFTSGGGDGGGTPPVGPHAGELALADGTTVLTAPGAHVQVLGARRLRVDGAALVDVVPGHGTFVVETAHGTIDVLGTRFVVDAEPTQTIAAVVRGEVELTSAGGNVSLHAGEQGTSDGSRVPTREPAPRLTNLVSWARDARHREERDVIPLRNGTLFAREPNRPWMPESPLPIAKLAVDVVVEDQVARVALDQTFFNPATIDMEGMYRFAIPPDAALQRLAMYNHGKLTESAVVERMAARRIYEDAVYRRVDPALLEWAGTGRLALRVYPLPAQQDKRLVLAYTQSLAKLYDDWTLTVPLPEIDQPVGELTFDVRVRDCAGCELTSTSHQITVTRDGDDALVHYQAKHERIGDSLVIHVRDPRRAATVATANAGSDSYLLVRSPANLHAAPHEYRPHTWVILDDVSASRDAMARRAQADLVDAFLRELDEHDRVSVLTFDVASRRILAPTRVLDVDRKAVRAALRAEAGGVGATDLGAAFDAGLAQLAGAGAADATIVYLGDGVITAGPRTLDTLRTQLVGKARFVGVGVGDGPDTQTLDSLAAATGGYSTTIDLADDLGWRAFDLVAALHTARVTGLQARLVDADGALVPSTTYLRSAQLADGEELELVSKLAGPGSKLAVAAELSGTLDGAPWQRRISLTDAVHPRGDAGFLPRLWAQHHIAARLLAKHEPVEVPPCPIVTTRTATLSTVACPTETDVRDARDEAIRKDIVELGKHYFLLSRHTSLLVLEDDAMYARYGVTKGTGDTWAPYALPATIAVPVVSGVAFGIADNALLSRTPLPVFNTNGQSGEFTGDLGGTTFTGSSAVFGGLIGVEGGGFGVGKSAEISTRTTLGILGSPMQSEERRRDHFDSAEQDATAAATKMAGDKERDLDVGSGAFGTIGTGAGESDRAKEAGPQVVTTAQLQNGMGQGYGAGGGRGGLRGRMSFHEQASGYYSYADAAQLTPMRLYYPSDPTFDDVTEQVPALFADASDAWRDRLAGASDGQTTHAIDDTARAILTEARKRLPTGVYRWDGVELAVDDARRLGWRRTTDADLAETSSIGATTWTRRYPELDLDVTRPVTAADVGLALAYLPVWIAEPAWWTRWFKVSARGPREIALSATVHGADRVALVLAFDDQYRLTAVHDGDGQSLIGVTWGAGGPTAGTVAGRTIDVGFTGQAIGDAAAWAHGSAPASGVVVELPGHLPAYWRDKVAAATVGSAEWRRLERQRLVADAAVADREDAKMTYLALLAHGGVELGDLALASSGVAMMTTDVELARALAPWHGRGAPADRPALVRYLEAGRAYGQSPAPSRLAHGDDRGMIGALWALREITAQAAVGHGQTAVDHLIAMGDRAIELRVVAAAVIMMHTEIPGAQVARAWDSVAVGPYHNIAGAQAALAYYYRGDLDAAADRLVTLLADLDLAAPAVQLAVAPQIFAQSRRGPAGWQLAWASWRDRVLAGHSLEHVLALLPLAAQTPTDLPVVLARAATLAAGNPIELTELARRAVAYGQAAWAQSVVDELVTRAPSRELYQLDAQLLTAQGRTQPALAALEAAQDAGGDEQVALSVVRGELGEIIAMSRTVALQASGAARDQIVTRALRWGDRWRAVDPGNPAIDQQLGDLELAVGNHAEAWRQLSSVIERDPMSGDGYGIVADAFERQGRVAEALDFWQQDIVIDQTNPTPRLRKAQALYALGRNADADSLLDEIAGRRWHDRWAGVVYQVQALRERGKQKHAMR